MTPKLSQNFLSDPHILKKIIEIAQVQENDRVLEIGPGKGALTAKLLQAGAHVTAIELDPLLAEWIRVEFPQVHLIEGNFLKVDLKVVPDGKVVANIPYHLTSEILMRLIQERKRFSTATLMVQKEVAQKLKSGVGEPGYGSFSILVNAYAEVTIGCWVHRRCFSPPPRVDSAVIHLGFRPTPLLSERGAFLVRTAFQQRRKMLSSSLKGIIEVEALHQVLLSSNLPITARPETLSIDVFERLASFP